MTYSVFYKFYVYGEIVTLAILRVMFFKIIENRANIEVNQ